MSVTAGEVLITFHGVIGAGGVPVCVWDMDGGCVIAVGKADSGGGAGDRGVWLWGVRAA